MELSRPSERCETPRVAPVKIPRRPASASPNGVCVCDLTAPLGLAQPSVSYHLRVLRNAGLVDRRQERNFAYYSVRTGALDHLATLLAPDRMERAS